MSKLYKFYIIIKYNFYKCYWKFKKPTEPSKFYNWKEVSYDRLNSKGIAIGILRGDLE